jgi:hypothetical protein
MREFLLTKTDMLSGIKFAAKIGEIGFEMAVFWKD